MPQSRQHGKGPDEDREKAVRSCLDWEFGAATQNERARTDIAAAAWASDRYSRWPNFFQKEFLGEEPG
jgi:hypothetical protein